MHHMTPEVEVDPELAVRAALIAEARGERLEDVIERALREYVVGARGDVGGTC